MHESLRQAFHDDGAVLVKGFLSPDELARCRAAFDWAVENHGPNAVRLFAGTEQQSHNDNANPRARSRSSSEVTRSIQRLLGWSHTPETFMGWVEIDGEMADPIRLLGAR